MDQRKAIVIGSFLFFFTTYVQCQEATPYVILISFDGFRNDYVERFDLKNFKKFAATGTISEGLIPCYPSKTFPNHYSIVTGLYPGHHGLVDNLFYDPYLKRAYHMRDRTAVTEKVFYGGIPIWQLCKENGIRTASFFWIGSEVTQEMFRPDYFFNYDQSISFSDRTAQVLNWLSLPEDKRPHFITLYFSSPDYEAHHFGPMAEKTKQALQSLDTLIGKFIDDIHLTRLPVNILLVSDHGMSSLPHELDTYIFIDEILNADDAEIKVVNGGTQAHLYIGNTHKKDSVYRALKESDDFNIYTQDKFPKHWHYNNVRSGDLLLVAKPNRFIVSGSRDKVMKEFPPHSQFGAHGYDPQDVNDMVGIFYAAGPNVSKGAKISAFENIHVYPLLCRILGLPIPEKIDGKVSVLQPIFIK
jgi:predicted AlkP superfamily pyrophosphatase or phosphodiesterase